MWDASESCSALSASHRLATGAALHLPAREPPNKRIQQTMRILGGGDQHATSQARRGVPVHCGADGYGTIERCSSNSYCSGYSKSERNTRPYVYAFRSVGRDVDAMGPVHLWAAAAGVVAGFCERACTCLCDVCLSVRLCDCVLFLELTGLGGASRDAADVGACVHYVASFVVVVCVLVRWCACPENSARSSSQLPGALPRAIAVGDWAAASRVIDADTVRAFAGARGYT